MPRHKEPSDTDLRSTFVGQFLREKRQAAGLTQLDVAKALRYTTAQFISNWERGLALPPIDVLPKLARLLGVESDEMIAALSRYQERLLERQKKRIEAAFKKRNGHGP